MANGRVFIFGSFWPTVQKFMKTEFWEDEAGDAVNEYNRWPRCGLFCEPRKRAKTHGGGGRINMRGQGIRRIAMEIGRNIPVKKKGKIGDQPQFFARCCRLHYASVIKSINIWRFGLRLFSLLIFFSFFFFHLDTRFNYRFRYKKIYIYIFF